MFEEFEKNMRLNYTNSVRSSTSYIQNSVDNSLSSIESERKEKKKSVGKTNQFYKDRYDTAVINIFNCVMYLLQDKNFILESLTDGSTKRTDLFYIINSAITANEILPK